ncbi:DUF2846 domain-containing protein [Dankookia sp. GCM10030260]|uniref:DUF2846 domain-containing protein n=1 Tax=Dankookia sp. GCM10030260 TaxID=3273390 RepID=UPI00360BD114
MNRRSFLGTSTALLGGGMLAACATGPRLSEMASRIPAVPQDKGRIWFLRSSSPVGMAMQPAIMLNGRKVGESIPGGAFWQDVVPGNYEVSTATEIDNRLTFTVTAGEERFVRTYVAPGLMVGRVVPELVDSTEGRDALASKSLTASI